MHFSLSFNSLCVLTSNRCAIALSFSPSHIIISMIPKRILLQNYILSGVVAVVVVVSLFTTAPHHHTEHSSSKSAPSCVYVCVCVFGVQEFDNYDDTKHQHYLPLRLRYTKTVPTYYACAFRAIGRFTCSRTGPRGAWCCLCGSRAASCTCPAPGARSPGGSCRSPSPSCRPGTGRGLA